MFFLIVEGILLASYLLHLACVLVRNLLLSPSWATLIMKIPSNFKATLYFYGATAKNFLCFLFKAHNLLQQKIDMEWRKIIFEKLRLFCEGGWQLFYNIISHMDF